MNKTFLMLCLLAACRLLTGHLRAEWPAEVSGVRWDATPANVKQVMADHPGTTLDSEGVDHLDFHGGTFVDGTVRAWRFDFNEGRLIRITIDFVAPQDPEGASVPIANFDKLKKLLEGKYGKARQGKAHHETDKNSYEALIWEFPDALHPNASKSLEYYHHWTPFVHGTSHFRLTYNNSAELASKGAKSDF